MSGKFSALNQRRRLEATDRAQVMLLLLALGDCTVAAMAAQVGVSRHSVDNMLRDRLYGMAHIAYWAHADSQSLGAPAAVWRLGAGVDAKKSSFIPAALKAEKPERDEEAWFDARARQLAAETRPFRHPMDTMLFGAAA